MAEPSEIDAIRQAQLRARQAVRSNAAEALALDARLGEIQAALARLEARCAALEAGQARLPSRTALLAAAVAVVLALAALLRFVPRI